MKTRFKNRHRSKRNMIELTEDQVRALRDKVFEKPTTDTNWNACKVFWMRPPDIRWLMQEAAKIDAKAKLTVGDVIK